MPLSCSAVGLLARAVEAVDRQAGLLVLAVADVLVDGPADAVLGAEQRDQLHAVGLVQQVDRRPAGAVAAGVVGDQADLLRP